MILRRSNNSKRTELEVLFVGSGAVNLCLAGWMHSEVGSASFLVRTEDNELIRSSSFRCRLPGYANERLFPCKAFTSLQGRKKPDLIVMGVKSYSLDEVVAKLVESFGDQVPVISVLNGVRHVEVIGKKFPNAVFATIAFNAFRTSPNAAVAVGNVIGLSSFDKKSTMLRTLRSMLQYKLNIRVLSSPMDAAHTKLVVNLGNALLAIVGFHDNRTRELAVLQRLTASIMWEGVQVMRKHGVNEARLPGMPSWKLIWLSKVLPAFIILPVFERKMRATAINSMAQDLKAGSSHTELEDINGYLIELADRVAVPVPINRALFHIFNEWLQEGAQPISPSDLDSRINSFSNR